MAELLPARLAQASGLNLDAMMGGKLSESDWGRLSNGAADLDRCLSGDQKPLLKALLAQIDKAAQAPAP